MIRKEKGDRQDFREIRAVGFTGDTVGRVKRQAAARGDFCSSVHGRVSERAAASPGDLRCSTGAAVNRAVPHLGTLLRADLKRKNPARTGGDSGDETCCGDRRRLDLTWPCTSIAPQQKRSQNSLRTNPSLETGQGSAHTSRQRRLAGGRQVPGEPLCTPGHQGSARSVVTRCTCHSPAPSPTLQSPRAPNAGPEVPRPCRGETEREDGRTVSHETKR